MLFVVHALDRVGAHDARTVHYEAHKAFLADASRFDVKVVMSGPLVTDDGQRMIGSLILVEAASRADVERFNAADPFITATVWERVTITCYNRRVG